MLHIAVGIALLFWLSKIAEAIREGFKKTYDPRRKWTRPYIVNLPTDAEERLVGIALAICSVLTAGIVIAVFAIAAFD